MGVSFILLALFTIFHTLRTLKLSAFSKLFLLRIIGLDIVLFVMIILAGKVETQLISQGLSQLNKEIFIFFSALRIPNYTLFRLLNVGIFLFCISIPLIIRPFLSRRGSLAAINNITSYVLTLVYALIFIVLNDPKILYLIYLKYQSGTGLYTYRFLKTVISLQHGTFFFFLFIYPLYMLAASYLQEHIYIKGKQILAVIYSLLTLNFFFYIFVVNNGFNIFSLYFARMTNLAHLSLTKLPGYYHTTLPLLLILTTEIFLIYLSLSQIMSPSDLIQKRIILRNSKSLRKNIGGLFHIFKNNYFNLYCLAAKLKEERGDDPTIDKLISEIQHMQKDLNKLVSSVIDIKLMIKPMNLKPIITSLMEDLRIQSPTIATLDNGIEEEVYVLGDELYLREALQNIVNNSVEAIGEHKLNNGEIRFGLSRESGLALVRIEDTGGGIPTPIKSKILHPQFSTKSHRRNWGMGLTFSYRVIKMHLGFMEIISRENQGTLIEIVLPLTGDEH